jgi:RibD C-terminal domain
MAAYWPNLTATDDPFAELLNASPKLVVSTTLQSVDWQSSTLITNDVIGEVTRRKQQPGKDILVPGSATLVRCLLQEGLVDELRLLLSRSSWAAASASLRAGLPGCRCGWWSPRPSTAGSSHSPTSQHLSDPEHALQAGAHQDRPAAQRCQDPGNPGESYIPPAWELSSPPALRSASDVGLPVAGSGPA